MATLYNVKLLNLLLGFFSFWLWRRTAVRLWDLRCLPLTAGWTGLPQSPRVTRRAWLRGGDGAGPRWDGPPGGRAPGGGVSPDWTGGLRRRDWPGLREKIRFYCRKFWTVTSATTGGGQVTFPGHPGLRRLEVVHFTFLFIISQYLFHIYRCCSDLQSSNTLIKPDQC